MPKPTPKFPEWIEDDNGCWIWQRSLSSTGYGNYSEGKSKIKLAHRAIYERHRGPIPKGLQLDHLCRVRACVNPDHLEPVTQAENIRRARQTHCKRGHDQSIHSYRRPGNGSTMCHACMLLRARWQREARRAA